MKTVHFASILVLAAATAFACNDEGDRIEGGSAGNAGENSVAGTSNSSAGAGAGGGDAGSANEGGTAGVAGSNEGGTAGVAGSNEGGAAGGGAGGETSDAGAAGAGFGGAGGAGGEGGAGIQGPLEIIGSWDNNYNGVEIITGTDWTAWGTVNAIVAYDNALNVVYRQSPTDSKFSKLVYTEVQGNSFHYCEIAYAKATLEDAIADTAVANASDLGTTGCGTFPWTKATRQ